MSLDVSFFLFCTTFNAIEFLDHEKEKKTIVKSIFLHPSFFFWMSLLVESIGSMNNEYSRRNKYTYGQVDDVLFAEEMYCYRHYAITGSCHCTSECCFQLDRSKWNAMLFCFIEKCIKLERKENNKEKQKWFTKNSYTAPTSHRHLEMMMFGSGFLESCLFCFLVFFFSFEMKWRNMIVFRWNYTSFTERKIARSFESFIRSTIAVDTATIENTASINFF